MENQPKNEKNLPYENVRRNRKCNPQPEPYRIDNLHVEGLVLRNLQHARTNHTPKPYNSKIRNLVIKTYDICIHDNNKDRVFYKNYTVIQCTTEYSYY